MCGSQRWSRLDDRRCPGWITDGVLVGSQRKSRVDHIGSPVWITEGYWVYHRGGPGCAT